MSIKDWYKSYLEEFISEMGSIDKVMSFERFCEFYDIDETTPEEELGRIFGL